MEINEKATEIGGSQVASSGNEHHNNNQFKPFLKTIIFRLAQRGLLSPNIAHSLINFFGLRSA